MNTQDAALLLGKSTRTIQQMAKDGRLSSSRDARNCLVLDAAEVHRLKAASCDKQFVIGTRAFTIKADDFQSLVRDYSNWTNTPASVNRICAKYNLTVAEFAVVRKTEGLTHNSPPFTDEEIIARAPRSLHAELLQNRKRQLYLDNDKNKIKETEKAAAKWWAFEEEARVVAEGIASQLSKKMPKTRYTAVKRRPADFLAVLAPTDWHYGKLATSALGKGAYDRQIALRRLLDYSGDIIDRLVATHGPDIKLIIYVGSDGVQVDNWNGTTTRGTPQDMDGHPAEIATGALRAWHQLGELARAKVSEVEFRANAGNHDRLLTHVTLTSLDLAYANVEGVTVAKACPFYDYVSWGQTLVMFHHGDGTGKLEDLAAVASTQEPKKWGNCPHRYALTGHRHHAIMKEGNGLRLIQLPSMAGSDAYHQLNWAAGHRPTLLVPVFHKVEGLVTIHERGAVWDEKTQDWK